MSQDIQIFIRELVGLNKEGYQSFNYPGLIPILFEALKDQQDQIHNLSKQLNRIDNKP